MHARASKLQSCQIAGQPATCFRLRLQTVAGWKHARFSVNALHRQNLCPTRTLQDPNPQGICNGASATLSPLLGKAGRWRPAPARHAIPMATHRPGTHNRLSYSNRARADTEDTRAATWRTSNDRACRNLREPMSEPKSELGTISLGRNAYFPGEGPWKHPYAGKNAHPTKVGKM